MLPDSLINTKYLAGKIHTSLSSNKDLDHIGFIKRYADIIAYTSLKIKLGIIVLLDFEKAFDTIKWSFIFKRVLNYLILVKQLLNG